MEIASSRQGARKAHRYVTDFGTNDYELYDLDTDIGERWNLAYDYPEIVEKLEAEIGRFKATVK